MTEITRYHRTPTTFNFKNCVWNIPPRRRALMERVAPFSMSRDSRVARESSRILLPKEIISSAAPSLFWKYRRYCDAVSSNCAKFANFPVMRNLYEDASQKNKIPKDNR